MLSKLNFVKNLGGKGSKTTFPTFNNGLVAAFMSFPSFAPRGNSFFIIFGQNRLGVITGLGRITHFSTNSGLLEAIGHFPSTIGQGDESTVEEEYQSKAVKELYTNRVAPLTVFNDEVLISKNMKSVKINPSVLGKFGKKAGIYLISYIHNPEVFYIGKAQDFIIRVGTHMRSRTRTKFYVFARLVG